MSSMMRRRWSFQARPGGDHLEPARSDIRIPAPLHQMAQQQISIVGAGISGLVLGRCLLSRGINAVLYERDKSGVRYGYGITLRASAYRPLLSVLGWDEDAFRNRVAVDGPVGGRGKEDFPNEKDIVFRANRMRLEELLREGLDVRWEHKLSGLNTTANGISLEFGNDQKADTQIVVGTDGVHSQVRKIVSPKSDFNILPFTVYNGKRRLDPSTYEKQYAPYLKDINIISQRIGSTSLQISVNEVTPEKASISYTYSRPAQQPTDNDPLFRPTRSISGATQIPSELYAEVDALQDLEEPFKSVFNSEAMKDDRILNWLMRSILVHQAKSENAAEDGIALLGDSFHHGPILGSNGANEAIEDAMGLAEIIVDGRPLKEFYKSEMEDWKQAVENNEARLAEMHGKSRANL